MSTPIKYWQLANRAWVAWRLNMNNPAAVNPQQLAEEIGCPPSSVKWTIDRYFTDEQKENIKWKRNHRRSKDGQG